MSLQRVIIFILQIMFLIYVLEKIIKVPEQELECSQYKFRCNSRRSLIRWLFAVTDIVGYIYIMSVRDRLDFRSKNCAEAIKRHYITNSWMRRPVLDILPYSLNFYLQNRGRFPSEELMKHEWARFKSFKTYPDYSPHFPLKLAKAGFYYTREGEYIKCFCCGLRLDSWPAYETIKEAHQRLSPHCNFVKGESNDNPIQHLERNPFQYRECGPLQSAEPEPTHVTKIVKYPDYGSTDSRRVTFTSSPLSTPSGEQRAEAGLFYAGFSDYVRSFCCGQGIRYCEAKGNPLIEHAPNCENGDLESIAARRVMAMGYSEERVLEAIVQFRNEHGNTELSAELLLGHILDTEPDLIKANKKFVLPKETANLANSDSTQDQEAAEQIREKYEKLCEDQKVLQEENSRLMDLLTCKICLDKESNVVFIPCGHMVCCETCAPHMRKCAVCRQLIKGRVKTFMS